MHTVSLPRTCLGFTNILFFVVSLVGFVICFWCAVNTEFFREVNYTVTNSALVDAISKFVNLKLWLTPMTTVLMSIAVLTMMTSCCGIIGAGCKVKCAIKSYILLVTVTSSVAFWLFFISGIYNVYTRNEKTRISLQTSINNNYGKDNDLITYVWDYVMVNYECCGAVNYRDFSISHWQKLNPNKLHPVQCCMLSNKISLVPISENCTLNINDIHSYREIGCVHALRDTIKRNKGKIIFYIILLSFSYVCVVLFAYCIIKGEPLLGTMAGKFTDFLPSKAREDADKVIPSNATFGNTSYVEEQPKKVVKVVSAANPFQSYHFAPNEYNTYSVRDMNSYRRPM